jgi:hypothetical protein
MSTEEQRAKWREQAQKRRDAKNGSSPARAGSGPPAFLRVETQEVFSIATNEGTEVCLQSDELEQLYQWWKVKRKL